METQGDFIRFLIREVETAAFSDIEDVVPFVKWLDDELSYLVNIIINHNFISVIVNYKLFDDDLLLFRWTKEQFSSTSLGQSRRRMHCEKQLSGIVISRN